MISIISYPEKTVNAGSNVSKWNAVHHPIKFQVLRRDYDVFLDMYGTSLSVLFGVNPTSFISIGDTLSFQTNNFVSSGTGIVTTISGNTVICTLLTGSLAVTQAGFVNLDSRKNFYIKTKVWGVQGLVGNLTYYLLGTSTNRPSDKGLATVDVSTFLKSNVDYENEFDYNVLNWLDSTLGGMFNVSFSENWTGHEGAFSGLSETDLNYYTNSAKQIQDVFGSNMGEYVPFLTYAVEDTKAKFLSSFEKPTYFTGLPFDLSFIYSEKIWGFEFSKYEETKNINGVTAAITNNTLDFNDGIGVHRLMLAQNYASTIKTVDVWLDNSLGGTISPIPIEATLGYADYVDEGYYETITELAVL